MEFPRDEIGEVLAGELYLRAGLDLATAPGAPRVAVAVLGERCLHAVPHGELPGNALIRRVGRRWVIYVRETLTARQLNHAVGHELGEWFLRDRGYDESDIEELAGRVAAAICVPRCAFIAAYRQLGEGLPLLSRSFRVSESLMALRVAECLGCSTALITRRVVRMRGEPREWPSTRDAWNELVVGAREKANGLTIGTLTDSRGRVVLRFR